MTKVKSALQKPRQQRRLGGATAQGAEYQCFAQRAFSGVKYSDIGDRGGHGSMIEGYGGNDEGAPLQTRTASIPV